ncbi:MAG: allantoinase AllB [Myxococcales bacterium]|nr:allantoinase AllB [Myxococcales bacterium]
MPVFRSQRVVLPDGIRPACVHVADGKIATITGYQKGPGDYGEATIMPGVVDTHVHVNEPGRTEWEGFRTATESAAAGGITSIVDMPLNSVPVTTTLKAFETKREAARGQLYVDVGYWGGVVPGNVGELSKMVAAGVLGFKCFLIDSGIAEFGWVAEPELRPAMEELARAGAPLLVHAEVAGPMPAHVEGDPSKYATYLKSRPRASENEAVALAARLCAETQARTHIVHHSSSDALETLREFKHKAPLTAETCPHYLHFAAEEIPDGRTEFKCAPPIRERDNREALWRALEEGVLDMIASDHSPCAPNLKSGDFEKAWGGVSGLQLALPVAWTEARKRGFSESDLARWMCAAPARLAGLQNRKGSIAVGFDADFCIWRPERSFTVDPAKLHHRHKLTPYAGQEFFGVVDAAVLRGEIVRFDDPPRGRELLR